MSQAAAVQLACGEQEVFQTKGPNFVMVIASVRRTGICQEQRNVWYSLCNRNSIRPTAGVIPTNIHFFLTASVWPSLPADCRLQLGLIAISECWSVSKRDGDRCECLEYEECELRSCIKWKEAKAALANQASEVAGKNTATGHPAAVKAKRAKPYAGQIYLSERCNHVRAACRHGHQHSIPKSKSLVSAGHGGSQAA